VPKRSEKIIPPVTLERDSFALRAKRARNMLQPTQGRAIALMRSGEIHEVPS
jgi:hypothetical protein